METLQIHRDTGMEDKRQRIREETEDGGQKTEDGRRKTEDGGSETKNIGQDP